MIWTKDSSVMSDKLKFILGASLVLIVLQCTSKKVFAQSTSNMSKMYGEIGLTTNYVDRGITQSNKGPSLNAGLGYHFGSQGKIGLDAASVNYPNESANVEMRVFGEYKFVFTSTADLRVRDDLVRYFSDGNRNKMLVSLDQNIMGYHILVSREDNFEGTKKPRNWFALHKEWPYGTSYQILGTVGYSQVADYDAFFDVLAGINYLVSNMTFGLSTTFVTPSSQFEGTANQFFIFSFSAHF
jgi:uncharacterized protein (TIGR02001 family)